MASRSLDDLTPVCRGRTTAFLEACAEDDWLEANGITILVTCTFRSRDEQLRTYAQGRTRQELDTAGLYDVQPRPGKVVTWALPGQSKHNRTDDNGRPAAEAVDIVPLRHGKPIWGTAGDGIDEDPSDDHTDDLEVWQRVGAIGERCGLKWAGRWQGKKREFPHFEI